MAMSGEGVLDDRCTSAEIRAAAPTIAVLGIGAIEQHAAHLPLGTDWLIAAEVSRRVACELGAFLVPPLPFSMSQCHGPAPGTVWLRPETLSAVLRDIVLSLRAQGTRQVLVVNGHGGNFVLEPAIRELNLAYPDLMVVLASVEGRGSASVEYDLHAGEVETSILLALDPSLVGPERPDCAPDVGREFLDYVFIDRIAPRGAIGRPSTADEEKGRRILAEEAKAIAEMARQAFATLAELKRGGSSGQG